MKFKSILIVALVIAALAGIIWQGSFADRADAATSNPSPGSAGYQIVTATVGTIGVNTWGIPIFKAPWPYRVVNVMTISRTSNTTSYAVMVKTGGTTSLLSSVMSGTTAAWTEGTLITNPNIADEATVSMDIYTGAQSVSDLIVELVLKRL